MNPESDFRLSRIYAEGWNSVRRIATDDLATLDDAAIAALNPYPGAPERLRWSAGFSGALKSSRRQSGIKSY